MSRLILPALALSLLFASPRASAQVPWGGGAAPAPAPAPKPAPAPAPDASPWAADPPPAPAASAPSLSVDPGVAPAPLLQLADPGDAHVSASLVLHVTDREAAAEQVVAMGEAAGGWFSEIRPDLVALKVPRAQVRQVARGLEALGDVADRGFERTDLGPRLGDLRSQLASRESVLDQYLAVLATASPKSVVSVEREVTRLVSEIESIKGQLAGLEHRSAYADLVVSFRFRERRAPNRGSASSFGWINTLNVADLLEDFEAGDRASRSASQPTTPPGFAAYRRTARFQAVSPDGVVTRTRSVRHKPTAALSYWQEAIRERMAAAGYTLIEERAVTAADGTPGALFRLGAANGASDLVYRLTVFVDGGRLVLVESAGDAEKMGPREAALDAALQGLNL